VESGGRKRHRILGRGSLGWLPTNVSYTPGAGLSGDNVYQWFGGWTGNRLEAPNFISEKSAQLGSMFQGIELNNANFQSQQGGLDGLSDFLKSILNQYRCDNRLARIFGGDDAVMGTIVEPNVLRANGTRGSRVRNGPGGENPELGDAHLFSNRDGTGVEENNAFTPPGYQPNPERGVVDNDGEIQNFVRFFYKPGSLSKYGYTGGFIVNFTHIGPTNSVGMPANPNPKIKNGRGSVLVGILGGFGSPQEFIGGSSDGYYTHSHMIFNTWDGNKSSRPNRKTRIDPRKVFCKDLGF